MPAPPTAETRQVPTHDARFYIVVRPYGSPWLIGRIPSTADDDLDKRVLEEEALARGWLVVNERSRTGGSETILNPIQYRDAVSTRDMKCEALKRCADLAAVIGTDASVIANKLAAATVLTMDNVLEQD
jgi:hypothetical protein